MKLRRNPTPPLTGKVCSTLYLLIIYISILHVIKAFARIKQTKFQFAVKTTNRFHLRHDRTEKWIAKSHPRTYKCRGHTQVNMSQAENTIVDFFTHSIEQSHVVIQIFSHTMGLYYLYRRIGKGTIQFIQISRRYQVVRIKNKCDVVIILQRLHTGIQRFDLSALLEMDFYQADGKSRQTGISLRLHVVGNHYRIITRSRILLYQASTYTLFYHSIFTVSRNQDCKAQIPTCRRR